MIKYLSRSGGLAGLFGGLASAIRAQRAVAQQVQLTGAAGNLSAQNSVQSKKDAEARRRALRLLGGANAVFTVSALAPAAAPHHDEEQEHDASDGRPGRRRQKKPNKPPPQR